MYHPERKKKREAKCFYFHIIQTNNLTHGFSAGTFMQVCVRRLEKNSFSYFFKVGPLFQTK
jgi:hypothetical protein